MNVRLLPPRDKLVRDDDALLLYSDELIRLSGLGTAIAELAINPITISNLCAELVQRFGSPDGAISHARNPDRRQPAGGAWRAGDRMSQTRFQPALRFTPPVVSSPREVN
ncbi:Protein of unknown function [Propionibacterium freudenreichii]|nr:Protein of unknown function [Propionibacterium freudenreichii]